MTVAKILGGLGIVGLTTVGVATIATTPAAKSLDIYNTPIVYYGLGDTIYYPNLEHTAVITNLPIDTILSRIENSNPNEGFDFYK
jgi:hypothetical protein